MTFVLINDPRGMADILQKRARTDRSDPLLREFDLARYSLPASEDSEASVSASPSNLPGEGGYASPRDLRGPSPLLVVAVITATVVTKVVIPKTV